MTVDQDNSVNIVNLDFAKAFDKVAHQRLQKTLAHVELKASFYTG